MAAYYQFIKREQQDDGVTVAYYKPTEHAQGAWNEHEQHMAPATGLLTAELTGYVPQANTRVARISLDILGLIPLDDFTITTRCIRPGKTIELIEAVMSSRGRDAIIARAWRLMTQDTSSIAGIEDRKAKHKPEDLPVWNDMQGWPGGFIESVRLVADPERRPGKGMVWITNDVEMVEGQLTDDMVHLVGMVDTANGVVPRLGLGLSGLEWMFPNTDLQIHMHCVPKGRWLGIEAVQQYGDDGIGLTSAVLHDVHGPFGRSEQILTIRPMPR
ncbi:thioesterase family protein [Psychrobacter sp. AOP29-E1-7]|uniref:thioesterase family protein n=1 Tax=Psychrobacter sp. AOP29-E1-7 TaxID=3457702 RepID=UPI004035BC80